MKRSMKLCAKVNALILLLVVPAATTSVSGAGQHDKRELDKRQVVGQARQAYYSLTKLGLLGFQASIKPNWEGMLRDLMKSDPSSAAEAVRRLDGIHFFISFDSQGNVKVTHTDIPAENETMAAGLKQIYDGMNQMIEGFFQSWNTFMLTSPFPEVNSEYELQDSGGQYLLSYKDGGSDVSTTMTRVLVITEVKVSSTEFKSSLRPRFMPTPKGFVLIGYAADYDPAKGPGKTRLNVTVDYQEVNGLQLPRMLHLDGSYDETPFQVEVLFSDYQVKTR